jgi:putative flippase GtrA
MTDARLSRDALRFLVAGGINTALTSLVYIVGLTFLPPAVSYALAWLCGLALVMVFYPRAVFPGGRRAVADRLAIGASTVVVFLIGLAALELLRRAFSNPVAAFFVTLALTTVLNFSFSRWIIRRSW